jgi:protein-L-isoaspartate(D-aspartate) O-methyltransferase
MTDSYRDKGLRAKLVKTIQGKGITDQRILDAVGKVKRHLFMDNAFINFAYQDNAFPIGAGQTISQPYTVAFQTQLLEIKKGEKVLEVGTGSGYQTAILLEIGVKVFTIERQKELYLKSQTILSSMGYKPHFFYGDGYIGKPTYGPFDKILITAGAPEIPEKLIDQLKVGGILVAPIGNDANQIMTKVIKGNDKLKITEHGDFVFVPMLKGKSF